MRDSRRRVLPATRVHPRAVAFDASINDVEVDVRVACACAASRAIACVQRIDATTTMHSSGHAMDVYRSCSST
jgi:hypothetical protein